MNIIFVVAASLSAFANDYVVKSGDTILKISDRTLGIQNDKKDPRRYEFARAIVAKNPSLKDPNVLHPGQTLSLPEDTRKPSATETTPVAAAPVKKEEPAAPTPAPEPAPAAPVAAATPAAPTPSPAPEAPPAKPATELVIETKHHEAEESDFLVVQPRTQLTHFKLKNEETGQDYKMNAQTNVGLGLAYGKALGGDMHLLVQAGFDYVQAQNLTGDEMGALEGKTQWLKNLGLGLEWHATHDLRVELLGMYNDRLFVVPGEDDVYQLKRVAIPMAELALKWNFLRLSSSTFGLGVAGEYLGAVSKDGHSYKAAFDPVGSLYWESACGAGHTNYGLTVYYAPNAQHAKEMEQEVESLGLNLNLVFPL